MMLPETLPLHFSTPPLTRHQIPSRSPSRSPLGQSSQKYGMPHDELQELFIERGDIDEEGGIREESPFFGIVPPPLNKTAIDAWMDNLPLISIGGESVRAGPLFYALHSLFPGALYLYGGFNPIPDEYLINEINKIFPEPSPYRSKLIAGIRLRKKSGNDIDLMVHLPHNSINCEQRSRYRRKAANLVKVCLNRLFNRHVECKENKKHDDSATFIDAGPIDIMINHESSPLSDSPSNALFLSLSEYFEHHQMHPIFFGKTVFGEWLLHNIGKIYTLITIKENEDPHPTLLKRMLQFQTLGFSVIQKQAEEKTVRCFLNLYLGLPDEKFINGFEKHLQDHYSDSLAKEVFLLNLLLLIDSKFTDKKRFFAKVLELSSVLRKTFLPFFKQIGGDADKVEEALLLLKLTACLAADPKIRSKKKGDLVEVRWSVSNAAHRPADLCFHFSPGRALFRLIEQLKERPSFSKSLVPPIRQFLFQALLSGLSKNKGENFDIPFPPPSHEDPPFLHLLYLVLGADPIERIFSLPFALMEAKGTKEKHRLNASLFEQLGPAFQPLKERLAPLITFQVEDISQFYGAIFLILSKTPPYVQRSYQLFKASPFPAQFSKGYRQKIDESFFITWVDTGSQYGRKKLQKLLEENKTSPWDLLDLMFTKIESIDENAVPFLTLISSFFWCRKEDVPPVKLLEFHSKGLLHSPGRGVSAFANVLMEILSDRGYYDEAFCWLSFLHADEIEEAEMRRTQHTLEVLFLEFLKQQKYKSAQSVLDKIRKLGAEIDSDLTGYWNTLKSNLPKKITKPFSVIALYLFQQFAKFDAWPKICPLPTLVKIAVETPSQKGKRVWYGFFKKNLHHFDQKNRHLVGSAKKTILQKKDRQTLTFALDNGHNNDAARLILEQNLPYDEIDKLINRLLSSNTRKCSWRLAFKLIKDKTSHSPLVYYSLLTGNGGPLRLKFAWQHFLNSFFHFQPEAARKILSFLIKKTYDSKEAPEILKMAYDPLKNTLRLLFKGETSVHYFDTALSILFIFHQFHIFLDDHILWEKIIRHSSEQQKLTADLVECAYDSGYPINKVPVDLQKYVEKATADAENSENAENEKEKEEAYNFLTFLTLLWLEKGVEIEKSKSWIRSFEAVLLYFQTDLDVDQVIGQIEKILKEKDLSTFHTAQVLTLPLYTLMNVLIDFRNKRIKRQFYSSLFSEIVLTFFHQVSTFTEKLPQLKIFIASQLLDADYFHEVLKILPQSSDDPNLIHAENTIYASSENLFKTATEQQIHLTKLWTDLLIFFEQLNDKEVSKALDFLYPMIAREEFLWDRETHPYHVLRTGGFYRLFLKNRSLSVVHVNEGIGRVIGAIFRMTQTSLPHYQKTRLRQLGSWYWALIGRRPFSVNSSYHCEILDAYEEEIERRSQREYAFLETLEKTDEVMMLKEVLKPNSFMQNRYDEILRNPNLLNQYYIAFIVVLFLSLCIYSTVAQCRCDTD